MAIEVAGKRISPDPAHSEQTTIAEIDIKGAKRGAASRPARATKHPWTRMDAEMAAQGTTAESAVDSSVIGKDQSITVLQVICRDRMITERCRQGL